MNLTLITPAPQYPITLSMVEGQTRLTDLTAEVDVVDLIIGAVTERAEAITKRALMTQTWELTLDGFPSSRAAIQLPKPPLQTVNSITYLDSDEVEQILDPLAYRVITTSEPGYVLPAYNLVWPSALDDVAVVTINFTCGYGPLGGGSTSDNIPKSIKQWMLINAANLFENRESIVIGNRSETLIDLTSTLADGLLENYRIFKL